MKEYWVAFKSYSDPTYYFQSRKFNAKSEKEAIELCRKAFPSQVVIDVRPWKVIEKEEEE